MEWHHELPQKEAETELSGILIAGNLYIQNKTTSHLFIETQQLIFLEKQWKYLLT